MPDLYLLFLIALKVCLKFVGGLSTVLLYLIPMCLEHQKYNVNIFLLNTTLFLQILISFRAAGSGWILILLLEICLQTCMTYTIAECIVNNSWWLTEELSETCEVSFQNKIEKLVHLVGFILRICHDARSHERKIYS
jgi:hypothetical protein